jgi:hypothetical protein
MTLQGDGQLVIEEPEGTGIPPYVSRMPGTIATTTSLNPTFVMAGVGQYITPSLSGVLLAIASLQGRNATSADGVSIKIAYGTGTAPTNGAAATGTVASPIMSMTSSAANAANCMTCVAMILGLTIGTVYWIDLQYAALTGGTATIENLNWSIVEL